jgi:hypothetical protein
MLLESSLEDPVVNPVVLPTTVFVTGEEVSDAQPSKDDLVLPYNIALDQCFALDFFLSFTIWNQVYSEV